MARKTAAEAVGLAWVPYTAHPYKGKNKVSVRTIRPRHVIASSTRLKEFRKCMKEGLKGKKYSGTPAEKMEAIQRAFADVAKSCKMGV